MLKTTIAVGLVAAMSLVPNIASAKYRHMGTIGFSDQHSYLPPVGYTAQHWVHPTNGCTYSKAGRPGERVWYMISNNGASTQDCVRFVVEQPHPTRSFADYYNQAPTRSFVARRLF